MNYRILLCFSLLFSFPVAVADSFSVSHSCSKPYKPFEFSDRYELDNFLDEVERYKQCITDFVDEQNEAIRIHRNAAEEAISEWDNFASDLS